MLAFGALVVWAIVHGARVERERTEALAARAKAKGFTFTPRFPGFENHFRQFGLFNRGHSREGRNIASAEVRLGGIPAQLIYGDYTFSETSGSGKNRRTVTYNASFAIAMPKIGIQETLVVRGEGFLDRIGEFVGIDDIDFESSEFSKRFHVTCSDRRFAYDLFEPRMMEYFLGTTPPRVEYNTRSLLFMHGLERWEPARFDRELAWIDGFFERIPRHVRAARLPPEMHADDPVLNPKEGMA